LQIITTFLGLAVQERDRPAFGFQIFVSHRLPKAMIPVMKPLEFIH
jgi:hypothetical protein